MNPMLLMMLMQMAPQIIGAMKGPQAQPNNYLNGVDPMNIAKYAPYMDSVMKAGFDPQSEMYARSSQVGNAGMKDFLANKGILNSSAGDMAMAGLQTQQQNAYINNLMSRQSNALNTVSGFMNPATATNLNVANAKNDQGWNYYNATQGQNQIQQGQIQGIANAASMYPMMTSMNNQNTNANNGYNQYMNYGTQYSPGGGSGWVRGNPSPNDPQF